MPKYAHGKKKSKKKFLLGILIVVGFFVVAFISKWVTTMILDSNQKPMDLSKYEDATPEELREMLKEKDEEIKDLEDEVKRLRRELAGSVSTAPGSSIPLTEPTPPKAASTDEPTDAPSADQTGLPATSPEVPAESAGTPSEVGTEAQAPTVE